MVDCTCPKETLVDAGLWGGVAGSSSRRWYLVCNCKGAGCVLYTCTSDSWRAMNHIKYDLIVAIIYGQCRIVHDTWPGNQMSGLYPSIYGSRWSISVVQHVGGRNYLLTVLQVKQFTNQFHQKGHNSNGYTFHRSPCAII